MTDYYKLFGLKKEGQKKLEKNVVDDLLKPPSKDKGPNMPHFDVLQKNATHQADLLFMPTDKGYKYILAVVDNATRALDAEPLKGKTNKIVLKAMQRIYKRKWLNTPSILEVDSGTEFKGSFSAYFKNKHVFVRVARTGRHRQQGMVEALNNMLSKALNRAMAAVEERDGIQSNKWVSNLPHLVKILNKKQTRKEKDPVKSGLPTCAGKSCDMLTVGTKVRVVLDFPVMNVANTRVIGKFRQGDRRWERKVRSITHLSLRPDQPPMYMVSGIEKTAYTKNQLQVVEDAEDSEDDNKLQVERFIAHRVVKKQEQWRVKWAGKPKRSATWQTADVLKEDLGKVAYDHLKKIFDKYGK